MLISKNAIFVNIFLSENNTGAMKKNIKNHKIHYHNLQLSFKHINLLNTADFLGKTWFQRKVRLKGLYWTQLMFQLQIQRNITKTFNLDTGSKLNIRLTFRRRSERLLNVLCSFNLRPLKKSIGYNKSQTNHFGKSVNVFVEDRWVAWDWVGFRYHDSQTKWTCDFCWGVTL